MGQDSTVLEVFGAFEGKTVGRALAGLGVLLLFFGTSLLVYFDPTAREKKKGGLRLGLRLELKGMKPDGYFFFTNILPLEVLFFSLAVWDSL